MADNQSNPLQTTDKGQLEERKKDHIELALDAQFSKEKIDTRFYYEPILAGHPKGELDLEFEIAGYAFRLPVWVSSMTGGTKLAGRINKNLARACEEFGMGMGLGSCRILLDSDEYLPDFQVKQYMPSQPLFANLGIAQLEQLIDENKLAKIPELVDKLNADGIIIHINPLQEFLQPEGDTIVHPPIDTIKSLLDHYEGHVIVKEVGQGMGYESLKALYKLPLEAVEFAANGGTNFSKLELMRSDADHQKHLALICTLGHTAEEMIHMSNALRDELGSALRVKKLIVSGGVQDFLEGYYYTQLSRIPAIYGQASGFLKHAMEDYEKLAKYVSSQKQGLQIAYQYLRIK